jgi:predicted MFS family arabinose efflux permease
VKVSAGTDATRVASYNPWVSLAWLITGRTVGGMQLYPQSNCLDRDAALRMWTENVTWFSNEEGKKGRIEVGQLADFVVPDRDFYACAESEIADTTALMTVVGGKVVYGAGDFASEDTTAPPPAMPDWSPVRTYGGYASWAKSDVRPLAMAQQSSLACSCSRRCGIHGHAHGTAWSRTLPIADLKSFWGALGCASPQGAFAPLRHTMFAVIWAATILGNIGGFMRDVASSWVITGLSANPAAVALIQTAATLPIFLLAIPAGVLSDILDRRRFLIFGQFLLAATSASLLTLSHFGLLTAEALIGLTFLGGVGTALMGPSWQAIVPELVPRTELKGAVALNSLGINIARAIGPALGGLVLASLGAAVTYGADVVSYVFVVLALVAWRRAPKVEDGLSEHFAGALRAGLRYARHSRELRVVLLRAAVFFLFASSVWALLPLVARNMLGGTASYYGVLLGAVGAGAIAGAVLLPKLRARLNPDALVLLASLIAAVVMASLSFVPSQLGAVGLMVALGAGWIFALTTLNGVAQAVLPNWVRGRGLAIYLMVFNGAMAAGSLGWGLVAQQLGLSNTLLLGAVGLAVAASLLHRLHLPSGEADLQPSNHWPEPLLDTPIAHDRGPVMVQIEYLIQAGDRPAFLAAMKDLSFERQRDGAYAWGVMEHSTDDDRVIEWFLVESWAEHLRQHHRVSKADADLQGTVVRFHRGDEPPTVQHFLALS